MLRYLPALLLAACSASVEPGGPPSPSQLRGSALAIEAWRERGLGDVSACDPLALWWRTVPPADVGRWCGDEPRACYRDGEITLPATRYASEAEMLTAHELVHWLGNCSGRWRRGDPNHKDREVWPSQVDATLAAMRARGSKGT